MHLSDTAFAGGVLSPLEGEKAISVFWRSQVLKIARGGTAERTSQHHGTGFRVRLRRPGMTITTPNPLVHSSFPLGAFLNNGGVNHRQHCELAMDRQGTSKPSNRAQPLNPCERTREGDLPPPALPVPHQAQ